MIAFGLVAYRVFVKAKLTIIEFNWQGVKVNSSRAHKLDSGTFRVPFIFVALVFGGMHRGHT